MRVRVKLYLQYRELGDEIELNLPEGAKVSDLLEELTRRGLDTREAIVLRDGNVQERDNPLREGVYSVFPPVDGG